MRYTLTSLAFLLLWTLCPILCQAQELDAVIEINSQKIEGTNKSVFETLKKSLTEFVNDRRWTEISYKQKERIKCTFTIIVNKYTESNGLFECECYVQSTRPVFNAAYTTNILQYRDKDFNFRYQEFDQLNYDDEHINNTLTALMAFYCYMIIGLDMDAMSPMGGTELLQKCVKIANDAQSFDVSGWKAFDDAANRFGIANDWALEALAPLRTLQYEYHRKGLDQMAENADEARNTITASILKNLRDAWANKPLGKLPLFWTETKRDEIVGIYKGKGGSEEKQELYKLLNDINASQNNYWKEIKN